MKAEQKKSNNGTEEEDSGKASNTVLWSDVDHDLIEFENWATNEANIVIHPSVRVGSNNNKEKSMGCQIRTFNGDIKKGEVLMTVPRHAMITPDLVAASDAGRAILACCCEQKEHCDMETTTAQASASSLRQQIQEEGGTNKSTTTATTRKSSVSSYWGAFENTVTCEQKFLQQVGSDSGTQLSFRILQERKRAEKACSNKIGDTTTTTKLAGPGIISTRAAFLAFLIHQRFHPNSRPPIIISDPSSSNRDFDNLPENCALNLSTQKNIVLDDGTPKTFGPYAQILPQSISLPICWNQDQLAFLDTVTGFTLLQEICCSTMQLTTEFIALIEAGILWRFPQIFPKGLLTWERWLWAASCFTSRILPMECYINKSNINSMDDDDVKCSTSDDAQHMILLQSPREIWAELGVMIPVLDMLNHDIELQSVKWESPNMKKPATRNGSSEEEEETKKEAVVVSSEHDHPRAIMEKDVQKGEQIFTCYGNELSNRLLILQYGFAQVGNDSDELSIGWGLIDAVGNVELPSSVTTCYSSLLIDNDKPGYDHIDETTKCLVYDSTEQEAIMKWWSEDRLILLERALPNVGGSFISSLKMGEKMLSAAHAEEGTYDPCLLTTAVYGTMPVSDLQHGIKKYEAQNKSNRQLPVSISKRHQYILRNYLVFFFSRKLEKMLQHLSETLKDSIPGAARLWTKASEGGLRYKKNDHNNDSDEIERDDDASKRFIGWRALFEENAKRVNGEKTSYTVDPKSCVFALYDGHLKALQLSVDDLLTLEKFKDSVLSHLVQLGFVIESEDAETLAVTNEEEKTEHTGDIAKDSKKEEDGNPIPSKRSRLK